ncbi:mCG144471, partial [Mus musculus]
DRLPPPPHTSPAWIARLGLEYWGSPPSLLTLGLHGRARVDPASEDQTGAWASTSLQKSHEGVQVFHCCVRCAPHACLRPKEARRVHHIP